MKAPPARRRSSPLTFWGRLRLRRPRLARAILGGPLVIDAGCLSRRPPILATAVAILAADRLALPGWGWWLAYRLASIRVRLSRPQPRLRPSPRRRRGSSGAADQSWPPVVPFALVSTGAGSGEGADATAEDSGSDLPGWPLFGGGLAGSRGADDASRDGRRCSGMPC